MSQSQTLHLADISAPTPTIESLAADRATIESLLDQGDRPAALAAWDRQRRAYATWSQLAFLRFQQDTEDQHAVAMRALADELGPVAIGHDSAIKQHLLADPDRAGLEAAMGAHIVRLWQADITTFNDRIAARLEEENRLAAAYTALTSSARLEIDGHIVNLSGLQPFSEHLDRATRYRAAHVASAFYEENGAALDDIFDQMVRVRTAMARELGYPSFTEL
ncbi:MAG TPA: peptidase M3, partial [Acetobacteraceae bacterium]|nr:peptidase M3 [Acetobacteraceae bacterium]